MECLTSIIEKPPDDGVFGHYDRRSKNVFAGKRARWETIDCKWLTIAEVFAFFRKEWLACPGASAQVSFDDRYGYIKKISFETNTEITDQFWDLTVSGFKAGR